ncbi:hypothetical protein FHR72_003972 [Mycolicibacterium iranicum]|uniref:HD domain-containing protein n=1 Tax=Mycolicibacterium iranicum TaxID=912594 RepID=A0A839QJM7_MYCIR|nr:HD domain-containing protein [Mycolicibacterium iranicum]MBB2992471.1 hypothetical protein [Mycolicibacterium iranicum]
MPLPQIVRDSPLAEEILASHRDRAGGDEVGWGAYRAHVYRVINFARALGPDASGADDADRDEKLAIGAAFHDLASFTTLDYLVPSIQAQDAWLRRTGRALWSDELALVVAQHHRLLPYSQKRPFAPLVEAVRRADLIDVSQGLIRCRPDRSAACGAPPRTTGFPAPWQRIDPLRSSGSGSLIPAI